MSRTIAILPGLCLAVVAWVGCAPQPSGEPGPRAHDRRPPTIVATPETREPIPLDAGAAREHRAVMLQHLESLQQIVAAMSRKDFERAAGLTELHLGFFKHRDAMMRQRPEDFPPVYHDLAMAHHQAAEELADVLPTASYDRIMPKLNAVLRACVACHLQYRVTDGPRGGE